MAPPGPEEDIDGGADVSGAAAMAPPLEGRRLSTFTHVEEKARCRRTKEAAEGVGEGAITGWVRTEPPNVLKKSRSKRGARAPAKAIGMCKSITSHQRPNHARGRPDERNEREVASHTVTLPLQVWRLSSMQRGGGV